MIQQQQTMILSPHMDIYDLVIPKDNLLRKINELIDFSFIYNELLDRYCLDNGRNAINPIRMFKYLLLKSIFDVSDIDVVERSKYDMSFKYFLDMAPEEAVIEASSLTKFRKLRLKDTNLLDMLINKTVVIAIEKGIIKSKSIIVDATHTKARYNQKSPKEILMDRSKKLRKSVYEIDVHMKEKFPSKTTTDALEDEIETHLAMSEERIITAATITTGEKADGKQLKALIEKSIDAGMNVENVIGDAAYSEKGNIEYANSHKIKLVAKLNPSVTQGYRKKEDEFEFNKDAGMYVCKAGHIAIRKARQGKKGEAVNQTDTYYFDIEKCKRCQYKEGCYKNGAKSKSYSVSIKSDEHTEQAMFQESDYFKEKSKERYKVEAKNSELKHRHGYDVASSSGLVGMAIQGAVAIFAVNLKRILKIIG